MKSILKRIADYLNEHWIFKIIVLSLPSIYLPFITKNYGKESLTDSDGNLKLVGILVAWLIYCSVLFINILANYKVKLDKEEELEHAKIKEKELLEYKSTLEVYLKLLEYIGNVCEVKLGAICSYIETAEKSGKFRKPFNDTVYPDKQLKSICKEIKNCLSKITGIDYNNITVSMAYVLPSISSKLNWVDQQETASCMNLYNLMKNPKTAFYKVYTEDTGYVFINDKKIASQESNYVLDKKDKKYNEIGSLICEEIAIENENDKIARIILTISTYGYKFTENGDEENLKNISDMIEKIILQQFEKRIKIELALLYVKKKYNYELNNSVKLTN